MENQQNRQSQQSKQLVRDSKFLALVLRHDPGKIGIRLDPAAWVSVETLLAAAGAHGRRISRARLDQVVAQNDKKRFEFDQTGTRIRASQGHSVPVELGYAPSEPPRVLYHGTATRFLASIFTDGLVPGKRHHVHLSADEATAVRVGTRHGRPAVLTVAAGRMRAAGHEFYRSTNGVWLTERVPAGYLGRLPDPATPAPPEPPSA